MKFDYYAELASASSHPGKLESSVGLISGFAAECTVWSAINEYEKEEARECYKNHVKNLHTIGFPEELKIDSSISPLPDPTWIELEISFVLQRPWYSKDDKHFHILDNPLRKDSIFGVPYMSASSWKGLLRWACRMHSGLLESLEIHNVGSDGWQDPPWIMHLFGNEKGKDNSQQGALVFYPTWFKKIDFEVINPHSRKTKAGTQPITYEVVPDKTAGLIHLLYAPIPYSAERDKIDPIETLNKFFNATEALVTRYGISAKRNAGWGTAKIDRWKAFNKGKGPIEEKSLYEFLNAIRSLLETRGMENE